MTVYLLDVGLEKTEHMADYYPKILTSPTKNYI